MDRIRNFALSKREDGIERLQILEKFILTLSTSQFSSALEHLSDEFSKFTYEVERLLKHASEMSDSEFSKEITALEEKGIYIFEHIKNYKAPPFVAIKKGQLFSLFQITLQKLQEQRCIHGYSITEAGDDFDFSIVNDENVLQIARSTRKNTHSFSLLRRYIAAAKTTEKDLDLDKTLLEKISNDGFDRARHSLAWGYIMHSRSEDDLIIAYNMIIECISSGLFDAYILFILLNNRIENFGLSNKDTENILKIMTFSGRTSFCTFARQCLAKLYAYGYVDDWEVKVVAEIDIDKAIFYAEETLKSKKNIEGRRNAIGVKLYIATNTIIAIDEILNDKKIEIDSALTMALSETKSSKSFSEILKNVSFAAKPYCITFFERLIIDADVQREIKNKARYVLAELTERQDPIKARELLISAAHDGCCDSQDVLFLFASGKEKEAQLLSMISTMIADREGSA